MTSTHIDVAPSIWRARRLDGRPGPARAASSAAPSRSSAARRTSWSASSAAAARTSCADRPCTPGRRATRCCAGRRGCWRRCGTRRCPRRGWWPRRRADEPVFYLMEPVDGFNAVEGAARAARLRPGDPAPDGAGGGGARWPSWGGSIRPRCPVSAGRTGSWNVRCRAGSGSSTPTAGSTATPDPTSPGSPRRPGGWSGTGPRRSRRGSCTATTTSRT